jgi:hypothetical protein
MRLSSAGKSTSQVVRQGGQRTRRNQQLAVMAAADSERTGGIFLACRSFQSASKPTLPPSIVVRRNNGLVVFHPIRGHAPLPCATLVAVDLIKLNGEDYRHQTWLGARKPAHSSAGGGGGGGGTPRK